MKHLVIGQRLKNPIFSAFHWSASGSLVSIGQHFVGTKVVHLPEKSRNKFNYRIGLITSYCSYARPAKSDQAVRAVHSCNSWLHTDLSLS